MQRTTRMRSQAIAAASACFVSMASAIAQPATAATKRHIFLHEATDSILAFGRKPGESVTPADLLSTEIHLHGRGIADEPLESLLRGMPATK